MCNPVITSIYDQYENDFLSIVPADEILHDLKANNILSVIEAEKIRKEILNKRSKNELLFEILRNERSDNDFFKICQILNKSSVSSVKRLGF